MLAFCKKIRITLLGMKAQLLCNTYGLCNGSLGVVCKSFINQIKELRAEVTTTEIMTKKCFRGTLGVVYLKCAGLARDAKTTI